MIIDKLEEVINFFVSECINVTKSKYIDGCFVDEGGLALKDINGVKMILQIMTMAIRLC